MPLFCDIALAARIERAEVGLIAKAADAARRRSAAGFVTPIAGGVACFGEPGSPFNKVAGLGFGGVPSAAALDEVEAAFATRGAPVQIELAHLGDPAIGVLLSDRGYALTSFENVLGRPVGDAPAMPAGIQVRPSGEEELDAWLAVVADGFAHPDGQGIPSHEDFPRDVIERSERDFAAAGVVRYAALVEGAIAGAGSLHFADGIAQLAGAATDPAYRRRGVHAALLAARLAAGAAAGCKIAVVIAQPGSQSQQNVQRHGFDLLYTRAVLVNAA